MGVGAISNAPAKVEKRIATTEPNTSDFGGSFVTPKLAYFKDERNPAKINYFVPNFGMDTDMLATKKHIKDSEKKYKHKWTPKKKVKKTYEQIYKVANFGLDKDILDAAASIKSTEKKLN